jgi:ribosomal protein L37AE/L43A
MAYTRSKVSETFHDPYHCDSCELRTWAHVQAVGVAAVSGYNTAVAEDRARRQARAIASDLLDRVPCPACGAASRAIQMRIWSWEKKAADRKRLRGSILRVGLVVSVLWSGSCGALSGWSCWTDRGGVLTAVVVAALVTAGGVAFLAAAVGIVYTLAGPGRRPTVFMARPTNVWFDAPAIRAERA